MPTRIAVQTEARAAAARLLEEYGAAASIKLQVYPARPRSIAAPCAFVDSMSEQLVWFAGTNFQRTPQVHIIVVHALLDSLEAATQRDAFCDGFLAYVQERPRALDQNADLYPSALDDHPAWVPDWMPPDQQRTYYATEIVLEGFAGT